MGVSRMYDIYCDECGTGCQGFESVGEARRWMAREEGWTTGPKGDYCLSCSPKASTPQKEATQ